MMCDGKLNRCVIASVCAALLGGCSSEPCYTRGNDGYSMQYDKFASGISLGEVRAINLPGKGESVAMLSYVQSASEPDFDYLTHVYAPANLDGLLSSVCKASQGGGSWRQPIKPVPQAVFSIDGSPEEMIFVSVKASGIFGVNASFCDDGVLSAAFMAGPHLSHTPWFVDAPHTIHIQRNGQFEYETLPGFAMVMNPRGVYQSGMFVVRGQHQVEVPAASPGLNTYKQNEVVVFTASFFENPIR